jgi:hypothetical protein
VFCLVRKQEMLNGPDVGRGFWNWCKTNVVNLDLTAKRTRLRDDAGGDKWGDMKQN